MYKYNVLNMNSIIINSRCYVTISHIFDKVAPLVVIFICLNRSLFDQLCCIIFNFPTYADSENIYIYISVLC